MPPPGKPHYITTPIFYVNAAPHVGHMYTMVLADVLKRWHVLQNRHALLCTGTDEHGMKIQRAAAKAGIPPQDFCDQGAQVFAELAASMDLSHDVFIRTSDEKHKRAVEHAWQLLENRGYIHEAHHQGWYSVSDETFYPPGHVHMTVDPRTGRKITVSIETGSEVEWTSERNYHFRLSAFRDRLLEFYAANPDFVVPKSRMHEIVAQVEAGVEDLSVSRPVERLVWGIRVPTDSSQTMYVWLDALLNYTSAAGFPFTPGHESRGGWPADTHVIGKDISRFHCIYWPAMLMALDLPLPKQVLTHAHWTINHKRMSKSSRNGVNPFFAMERFGLDVMRWYLIHEGGIVDDADYDNSYIYEKYKKFLQGGLGNLTSRVMRGKGWNVRRAVQRYARPGGESVCALPRHQSHSALQPDSLHETIRQVDAHMHDLFPSRALQSIMGIVTDANAHLQHLAPWTLVSQLKSTPGPSPEAQAIEAELDRTIFLSAEALRLVGIMLQPFMPTASRRLLEMLGVRPENRTWERCRVGGDAEYGLPMLDLRQRGDASLLFPALTSDA